MPAKDRGQRKVSEFVSAVASPSRAGKATEMAGRSSSGVTQTPMRQEGSTDLSVIMEELKSLRTDLSGQIGSLSTTLDIVKVRMDAVAERVSEAERRISGAEDAIARMEPCVKRQENMLTRLAAALEDQESRSRRSNLRILGVPEAAGAGRMAEQMEGLIPTLLPDAKLSNHFVVERAHRSLGKPPAPGQPPKAIIVRILNFRDRDEILRAARAKGEIMFENKRVSFYPDLTIATQRARKQFDTVKAELRKRGMMYAMLHPAKLRVASGDRAHFFEDPRKAWEFLEGLTPATRRALGDSQDAAETRNS